jgi:hypothetical protein
MDPDPLAVIAASYHRHEVAVRNHTALAPTQTIAAQPQALEERLRQP